jgi:digeranylgeranylglycerophospholipid reductase
MNCYDIVIVGLGPAGCMAALHSKGDILLVEKKKEIGIPVHCGEGVFGKIIDTFDLKDCVNGFHTLRDVEFNFPNKKTKKITMHTNDIYIINKDEFLQNILHKAVKKNDKILTIRTNTKASYKNRNIILNDGEIIDAKVIIAADGINSSIGRTAGISQPLRPEDVHVCAQYRLRGYFDPDLIRLFLDNPYAPSGYVWVFPKNEHVANIGLGVQGSRNLNAKKLLDWFIAENYPEALPMDFFTAPVSLAPPVERCGKDNILLVGDAARFCLAPSGAGIGNALLSGKIAGEIASKYLDGKCGLQAYPYYMTLNLYSKLNKAYNFKQKLMKENGANRMYKIASHLIPLHTIFPKFTEKYCVRNFRF